jgi:hypothetical protein
MSAGTDADATMQAQADITNDGAITLAAVKVELTSAAGNIRDKDTVEAKGTDVNLTAKEGSIENQKAVTAQARCNYAG